MRADDDERRRAAAALVPREVDGAPRLVEFFPGLKHVSIDGVGVDVVLYVKYGYGCTMGARRARMSEEKGSETDVRERLTNMRWMRHMSAMPLVTACLAWLFSSTTRPSS